MRRISEKLPLSLKILKQCREQIGLSLDEVSKKVKSIAKIETGKQRPTYRQMDTLAELYEVPSWVFIADTLPEEYRYDQKPSFRGLNIMGPFHNYKVRRLVARVERYRDLLIELREDQEEPAIPFSGPDVSGHSPIQAAADIRRWLGMTQALSFSDLRKKLEEKGLFVFLTSKYKGWAQIDTGIFRGLCLTDERMPIIIINDSDARNARSFTLIHELGHLLRNEIDMWYENSTKEERWCNEFAGNVLIPEERLKDSTAYPTLEEITQHAKSLQVSPYALIVRLRQAGIVTEEKYRVFEHRLTSEYEKQKEKFNKNSPPISRNRRKEVQTQFGDMFIGTMLAAWHSEELTLHKVSKLLGLKDPALVPELAQ